MSEQPSAYIKSNRDYHANDRERVRLKKRLRVAKNNATFAALKRRDTAAAAWRGRRMGWEVPAR